MDRHPQAVAEQQALPSVTVRFDDVGPVEIFYDVAPADPATDYPGYWNVEQVMLGSVDITEPLRERGLLEWVRDCAREQIADDARAVREVA